MTTQPTIRFLTSQSLHTRVCALLVVGLLVGSWMPATAQSVRAPDALAADAATIAKLADMLASPVDAERYEALFHITNIAYRLPEVDLTPTVPSLVAIYQNHPKPNYRYAALSALHAIGDEAGMEAVRDGVFLEPSLRVQYVALAATLAHFGPQAFGSDVEAVALANNVFARRRAATRFGTAPPDTPIAEKQ